MTKSWINFEHWSSRDPETFLSEDWSNDVRAKAFGRISSRFRSLSFSMAEVGPGSGHDYSRFVRGSVDFKNVSYTMYEGCHIFASNLKKRFPLVRVVFGGFEDLPASAYDVTYTKDTIEHQSGFQVPLSSLLRATRKMCVVSWFIPPGEKELIHIDPSTDLHFNRYAKADVLALASAEGFLVQNQDRIHQNEIYVFERKST